MTEIPRVAVVVPSFNQGQFLDQALSSIFDQTVPVEVHVLDGGSSDSSVEVIKRWSDRLTSWRSGPDDGQSAAINEGVELATAPYVCWLNSDDMFMSDRLSDLVNALDSNSAPASYGLTMDLYEGRNTRKLTWVEPFSEARLAQRCIISQPGSLIRRDVWRTVGGLDRSLHMALDYDLWWRIYKKFGPLKFVDSVVAVNRVHGGTKTNLNRRRHYNEAMKIVKRHHGRVPLKWWIAQPYQIWFRSRFREL